MTRPILSLDSETDPFKRGRIPKPFIWGLYDGDEFFHTEDLGVMIGRLEDMDCIVYAHNGGKFDYHYLFEYLEPSSEILIINGRISKFKIGKAEFRDSYNIIPSGLAAYEKEKFDYSLLEPEVRYKTENWRKIVKYLESDCINLFNMVTDFIDRYGMNLTLAGTAMKQWQKMTERKPPRSTQEYYEDMARFYYGGRVQCFQHGIIERPFKVRDINSAYPRAMLEEHPIGLIKTTHLEDISHEHPHYGACFFKVRAVSRGAFPFRAENGSLVFPDDPVDRVFHVTGWELQAARETGTAEILEVIECHEYTEFCEFSVYVNHFYGERQIAKAAGDKKSDLFNKNLLTGLYGKFGSNPDEYESNIIIGQGNIPDLINGELYEKNQRLRFSGELGPWVLAARDLNPDEKRYFNVATSASITGWVRAYLWRSICSCGIENMLYCDTDSIAHHGDGSFDLGDALGQWKHEGDFIRAGIGGKKLYIFKGADYEKDEKTGERLYKIASKGAKLTKAQLWKIAAGGEVTYRPENPSYSVHNGINFVDRKIRMTT